MILTQGDAEIVNTAVKSIMTTMADPFAVYTGHPTHVTFVLELGVLLVIGLVLLDGVVAMGTFRFYDSYQSS